MFHECKTVMDSKISALPHGTWELVVHPSYANIMTYKCVFLSNKILINECLQQG